MGENMRPHVVARARVGEAPKEKRQVEARPTTKLDSRELLGFVHMTRESRGEAAPTDSDLNVEVETITVTSDAAPTAPSPTPVRPKAAVRVVQTLRRPEAAKGQMVPLEVRAVGSNPAIQPVVSPAPIPAPTPTAPMLAVGNSELERIEPPIEPSPVVEVAVVEVPSVVAPVVAPMIDPTTQSPIAIAEVVAPGMAPVIAPPAQPSLLRPVLMGIAVGLAGLGAWLAITAV